MHTTRLITSKFMSKLSDSQVSDNRMVVETDD